MGEERAIEQPKRIKEKPARNASGAGGTEAELILGLLKRAEGASLDELTGAFGWEAHSVRGFGLSAEIQAISSLDLDGLRRRWRMLYGKLVPVHVPRMLLIRLITYRMQADAYGDLDRASKRLLDGIGRELRSRGS